MVFTLHRYLFRELLRIFILATIGMTLILSLGGILRPVQQYGIGPRQVIHILVYFMPITLTFVMPMAALFASALAYGRFTSDNEFDACRASGIGVLTLVYPGLVLAILVAIANLLLSFQVMPYFVRLAERSLKADAKQILFRNIQRRGFYALPPDGRFLIYADHADLKTDTLFGVVVVQWRNEQIRRIITSDETRVRFDPRDVGNEVHLTTYNAKGMGGANDVWFQIGTAPFKFEFGSLLGDDIKFKRIDEMKRISADLMQFDPIARRAHRTYTQLVTELLAREITQAMDGSVHGAYDLAGRSRSVRFTAAGCVLEELSWIKLLPPVIVDEYDTRSGMHRRRLRCQEAAEIHVEENTAHPSLGLYLNSPRVEATGQLIVRHVIDNLTLPAAVGSSLRGESILEQVSDRDHLVHLLKVPPSHLLVEQQAGLIWAVRDAVVDIRAEINSRLVFGIGCIPMILIGIGLGVIQRGGHLLGAFGASCLPAAVLVIAIVSGRNITKNPGAQEASGVLIMWGGSAFLALLAVFLYWRLRRS